MDGDRIAECINVLSRFCGKRDVPVLSREELRKRFGMEQADVMVLFGGSILEGAEVLAQAMRNGAARSYGIVGGEGHTTESLRRQMHRLFPDLATGGMAEADLFDHYLRRRHGLNVDWLERESNNCGNNVTLCLDVLQARRIDCRRLILTQDAAMQLRMEAGFRKYLPDDAVIINFAAYAVKVVCREGQLQYDREIPGMWDLERYMSLLLGEIPRLTDDAAGYGPRGRNYIVHVTIPDAVLAAFDELKRDFGHRVRGADARYAS